MSRNSLTQPATNQDSFSKKVSKILRKTIASAKRRGAWFSLDSKEKGLLSLAANLDLKFTSFDLLRAIAKVVKRLQERGDTLLSRIQKGIQLAWAFSEFAVACGNASARDWRHDRAFAEYLGRAFHSSSWALAP